MARLALNTRRLPVGEEDRVHDLAGLGVGVRVVNGLGVHGLSAERAAVVDVSNRVLVHAGLRGVEGGAPCGAPPWWLSGFVDFDDPGLGLVLVGGLLGGAEALVVLDGSQVVGGCVSVVRLAALHDDLAVPGVGVGAVRVGGPGDVHRDSLGLFPLLMSLLYTTPQGARNP